MNGYKVNRFMIVVSAAALMNLLSTAPAGTLFKDPVIAISPRSINFGTVPMKSTVTNTFLIENWGGGKLVGKATVAPPFKILSGGTYRLGRSDAQVLTITYTPSGAPLDTNIVIFTGGAGTIGRVVGKPGGVRPDASTRK
jgi:hypothetical protein